MPPFHIALAGMVILIWGGNFVVVKIGLQELPPLFFSTLRFALVAVLLVPFTRIPRDLFGHVFLYATLLGTLHFAFMFIALETLDASAAAILIQVQTPFAMVISALFFKDYPGWRRILGACVAFAGVLIIVGEPNIGDDLVAAGLVVAAAMGWALANMQMKVLGDRIGGFALNGWMALIAMPQLAIASWIFEGNQWQLVAEMGAIGWSSVLYQSILVVILGYGTWYWLLRRHPVSQMIPLTLSLPFLGILGGVLFLDEEPTVQLLIGGALTIAGVAVIVLREARRAQPTE